MKQISIDGLTIEIEKKRIKNMYLRILPPEGKIHISAPLRISESEIKRFIISKREWIITQQNRMQQRSVGKELEYVTGEEVSVWGKGLLLIVKEAGKRSSVDVNSEQLILTVKSGSTVMQRKKVLYDWYRDTLYNEIPELLVKWEPIIGVKSNGFTIRDMKTRWGTCNIRSKMICLNLQLAKKPPVCLEYVVVHELVHLLEKSHNYIFKAYMDKYLPQWRLIKKLLNYGIS